MSALGNVSLTTWLASGPPRGEPEAYLLMHHVDAARASDTMPLIAQGLHMTIGAWQDETLVSVWAESRGRITVLLGNEHDDKLALPPVQVSPDWTDRAARNQRAVLIIGAEPLAVEADDADVLAYIRRYGQDRCATGWAKINGGR